MLSNDGENVRFLVEECSPMDLGALAPNLPVLSFDKTPRARADLTNRLKSVLGLNSNTK